MPRKIIPYNPKLKELARNLRNNSTPGEIRLWQELKAKQFLGYDFHRQKPLLNYVVDFYCAELNLVIEIDGRYHEEITDKDLKRTEELEQQQLTILRFTEQEVQTDMFNVLRTLEIYADGFNNKIND
ncbi:MAG: endonuclease domain-containing protein [Mucilaginibacter sp.]|uniref:endonuclease domain-containing protein n=1 Tax=Mucilaginibacter sp. TaxID=1882438 RepID=UPI0034E56961